MGSSLLPIFQMGEAEERLKTLIGAELVGRGIECEHRQSDGVVQTVNLSTYYLSTALKGHRAGSCVVVTVRMVTAVIFIWCYGRKQKPPNTVHVLSRGLPINAALGNVTVINAELLIR